MERILALLVSLAIMVSPGALPGQDELPRVLIIGDSIAGMYSSQVSRELKGKVRVDAAYRPPELVLNSSTVLECLDQLLGRIDRNGKPVPKEKWPDYDLIHVNVGLGDLVHRVPNLKSIRLLPISNGGVITTLPAQYGKNLDELIRRLKDRHPKAKIVWASTTPIRHSTSNVFKSGAAIEYNSIAAEVMRKHQVSVNDMHSFVKNLINMDKPAGFGADPFHFDKKPIHMPVVRVIERAFKLPPLPKTEEEKNAQ
ncbi:MAG: SGNH/GDSL hydrolase family protein [Planctomycetota bacterium]|nr:SGNH/GDSL hydrolase family protein [Planctomycetota bacterium]